MKKIILVLTVAAALLLTLAGCQGAPAEEHTPAEPQVTAEVPAPAQTAEQAPAEDDGQIIVVESSESAEEPAPAKEPSRQDGERFEAAIMLEGMEEKVQYEHIVNRAAGFEMDYDYENFVRRSEGDVECFISDWDDPQNPENYLEVRFDTGSAELTAAAISATLSNEYEVIREDYALERAGSCIRLDASAVKGGGYMPDQLQAVYIIPAGSCSIVATAHYAAEASEGFGRRFAYMMQTLSPIERNVEAQPLSDELAISAVQQYCYNANPELESIVNAGEYPVYWEIASGDEQQVVVLFRSYTGAENRFYIDRISGEGYITEFVPGVTAEEQRTEESFNAWEYFG